MLRYPLAQEFLTTNECSQMLTERLAAYTAVHADAKVHLIVNDFAFTPGMTFDDLTEASGAWYTAKTVTIASFTQRETESNGSVRVQSSTLCTWPGPNTADGPLVYGFAITPSISTARIYSLQKFAQPFDLHDDTDVLNVIATITQQAGQVMP